MAPRNVNTTYIYLNYIYIPDKNNVEWGDSKAAALEFVQRDNALVGGSVTAFCRALQGFRKKTTETRFSSYIEAFYARGSPYFF